MRYEYSVPHKPGTYISTYVAQITGEDPKYHFHRRFLVRTRVDGNGLQHYICQIAGHGVFEVSIKRKQEQAEKVLEQERHWFVYYRKHFYEIGCEDVLYALFNLSLQYRKATSGSPVLQ